MVFMDNQRVQGNLFQLLDSAMTFIFKHLSLSGTTEALEREEHLTIPYKAIREGIINSLCHRQFRTPGGSVGIAIYDDRVEIENPGTFPHGWDMERMKSEHGSLLPCTAVFRYVDEELSETPLSRSVKVIPVSIHRHVATQVSS